MSTIVSLLKADALVQIIADIEDDSAAAVASAAAAEVSAAASEADRAAAVAARIAAQAAQVSTEATALNAQRTAFLLDSWAGLAAITGTLAGQGAEVLDADSGTHTDPVLGGTVPNAGRYSWSVSPAGWKRISTTGLTGESTARRAALLAIYAAALWTFVGELETGRLPAVVGLDDRVIVYAETVDQLPAYAQAVWSFVGTAEDAGSAPGVVSFDNRVLSVPGVEQAAQTAYSAQLWSFVGTAASIEIAPSIVSFDNRVLSIPGESVRAEFLSYAAQLWSFVGTAADIETAPNIVSFDNRVLNIPGETASAPLVPDVMPYVLSGDLRVIGGAGADRLVNDDAGRTWLAAQTSESRILAVSEASGHRELAVVAPETGNLFAAGRMSLRLGVGQSNGRGSQSGAAVIESIRAEYPFTDRLLMVGPNVWAGTGDTNAAVFDPGTVSALVPLVGAISGNNGTTAVESAALRYAQAANDEAGWVPKQIVFNAAVGAQNIAQLSATPPAGETCWANLVAVMAAIADLTPAGERIALDWMHMHQGESNTSTADLGAQHDAYRAAVAVQAGVLFGQTEPVRMIGWQPASYSTSTGARSLLAYHIVNRAERGLFWCAGPSYQFPFATQFLHHTALGHDMRGEYEAEAIRLIERTGYFDPLHMVSAAVTGANEITVTLNFASVIDGADDVVAAITNAGITLVGGTVSAVSVSGTAMTIATVGAAASVTAVRAAMTGQEDPRTAAAIPRTNIRGTASLGTYRSGKTMRRWLCAQEITL